MRKSDRETRPYETRQEEVSRGNGKKRQTVQRKQRNDMI